MWNADIYHMAARMIPSLDAFSPSTAYHQPTRLVCESSHHPQLSCQNPFQVITHPAPMLFRSGYPLYTVSGNLGFDDRSKATPGSWHLSNCMWPSFWGPAGRFTSRESERRGLVWESVLGHRAVQSRGDCDAGALAETPSSLYYTQLLAEAPGLKKAVT